VPGRPVLRLRLAAALGLAAACAGVTATAGVAAAAPAAPADSVRDGQLWALNMMDVPAAWEAGNEGQGVTVAVLDSGVAPDVSDLDGSVVSGPDLTGVTTPTSSPAWGQHGTWMASVIAGHGHGVDDDDGILGAAPKAKILSVRVIPDRNDPGYTSYEREQESRVQDSLAKGIRYAVDHGADVISMSIGYSAPSASVRSALQYAYGHGVAVVASSGNSGDTSSASKNGYAPLKFPADYPGVIGVAAVSSAGSVAGFSSDNLSVEVAAPGVNISAQGRDGQYWLVTGTSPACALVAGVAALIKAKYPGLAPDLLAKALTSTTHYRPDGGYDQKVGFGTVNATAALTAAGQLARQRAAQTGTAASTNFGGGPSAAPASPVGPRGTGQLILFAVLALTALVLVAASVSRLAVLKQLRRRTLTATSVPVAGSSFGRPPPTSAPPPTSPQPGRHHASRRSTVSRQPPLPQSSTPQAPAPSYAPPAPQAPPTSYAAPTPAPQAPPTPYGDPPPQGSPTSYAAPAPQAPPMSHDQYGPSTPLAPRAHSTPDDQHASHAQQEPQEPQEPYAPQEPPVAYESYSAHELYESQATRPLSVPQEQRRPQGWWPPPEADD
jgi:Subtilase family